MSVSRNHLQTIRNEIISNGLNIGDSDIFQGPLNEKMNDDCITMVQTAGPQADSFFSDPETLQRPNVQIRVRSDNYDEGKSDSEDIWGLMQNAQPTDYLRIFCLRSAPLYGGADDNGRHNFYINVELWIVE